jgi:transposase
LHLIGQLFHIDKAGPPEERLTRRQQRCRPVLTRIQEWILDAVALPEKTLRGALQYISGRWTGLTRFVDDAAIPLDNNLRERPARPGHCRHNHYGSKSRQGTEVAAAAYSITESAELNVANPEHYLLAAVAAFHAGTPIRVPHEFKPHPT